MKRRGTRKQKGGDGNDDGSVDSEASVFVTGANSLEITRTTTKHTSRALKALEPYNNTGVDEDAGIDIANSSRPKRNSIRNPVPGGEK